MGQTSRDEVDGQRDIGQYFGDGLRDGLVGFVHEPYDVDRCEFVYMRGLRIALLCGQLG